MKTLTIQDPKEYTFRNDKNTSLIYEKIGLMVYFMSTLQIGHWVIATAQLEHVAIWEQGKKTMAVSASMQILQVLLSRILSNSSAISFCDCGVVGTEAFLSSST